jgi:hypothetical protein
MSPKKGPTPRNPRNAGRPVPRDDQQRFWNPVGAVVTAALSNRSSRRKTSWRKVVGIVLVGGLALILVLAALAPLL